MKKIVLITNIPSPYRVDLFRYMQENCKEFEFHIIYTSESEDNRQWNLDRNKLVNSYILNSKIIKVKGDLDARYIHLPGNIGKLLNRINPDAVIAWEYNLAAVQALLWCKLKKRKLIHLTDGTLYSERNINVVQKVLRKIICLAADSCIASSTKAKEKIERYGVSSEKIFISLLTEDINKFSIVEKNVKKGRILYVGSMIKRKGLDLLFAALKYVQTDYCVHIVGNGSDTEKRELQNLANQLGISNKIIWCGYKEGKELALEYSEAEVFILPTREDCYGLVLLEALLSRTPIISSKYADGAYDIVSEDVGIIIDPYNDKEFALAIDTILKKGDYLDSIKNVDVSKFTFEETVKGYLHAIQLVNR